jgi:signal transduction histidine kinase
MQADPPLPTRAEAAPALGVDELEALVDATRAIAEVLDLDRVLQLIVDRVRILVDAEYAALGIPSTTGEMERFITSGISTDIRAAIGDPPRGHGLLGLIIREGRSYRIPRIAEHADSYGFPPNHPPMTSFLGVPVTVHGRSVGNLYLTDKRGAADFSDVDQLLVEMLALRAGIAIDNAHLHEQVQRLAVVEERERIGRDLHDGIIQSIYGVALSLEDVPFLMQTAPDDATDRVDKAIDSLNLTIRDIRNFILGLRSELIHGADLVAGLATLADEFSNSSASEIELDIAVDPGVASVLPVGHRVQILQMAREALSNAVRHSQSAHVAIGLHNEGPLLDLSVEDDGIGFDPDVAPRRGHLGLANLRDRTAALGGTLTIRTQPGRGTSLRIRVPTAPPDEPEDHAA